MSTFGSRATHVTAVLVTLGLMFAGLSLSACACSCGPETDALLAMEQADAVFAGRIVGLALIPDEDPAIGVSFETLKVTVAVHSLWKGEALEETILFTGYTCCVCGFLFQLGEEYLIYATADDDGTLRTSICSRTQLLASASEDLVVLGDLKPQSLGDDQGGLISP